MYYIYNVFVYSRVHIIQVKKTDFESSPLSLIILPLSLSFLGILVAILPGVCVSEIRSHEKILQRVEMYGHMWTISMRVFAIPLFLDHHSPLLGLTFSWWSGLHGPGSLTCCPVTYSSNRWAECSPQAGWSSSSGLIHSCLLKTISQGSTGSLRHWS